MEFEVVEQFVETKLDGRVCEDMIVVVAGRYAAVIDGASDETGARFAGLSGGRFAAEVIAATIKDAQPFADVRAFADSLASALSAAVADEIGELGDDVRWPVAAVVCASAEHQQVWRLGDGNVAVDEVVHMGDKRIDEAAYSFRAAVNAALIEKGSPLAEIIETDPGSQAARPLFDSQQHLANKVGPWGFGCVDGQIVPDEYLEVFPIPSGTNQVVITSDGFPVVGPSLRESERALSELVQRDPAAVGDLWSIGKSCKPGSNAPDDRAYLRLRVR